MIIAAALVLSAGIAAEPPRLAAALVCEGLQAPVWIGVPPGDRQRLFALEQRTGRVRIFDLAAQAWKPEPALTIAPLRSSANEQGLLGMAFHPRFAENGFAYFYFTAPGDGPSGHVEIARFTAAGDRFDPASKQVVLSIEQPEDNHNGGWIAFGPDGFLWLGVGDGGGGNDRHGAIGNGQDRRSLRGKLLRIDVDGPQRPYGIPKDNPFVDQLGKRPEIAAFGLRNPWRCAFDPQTGDLWIGDVGQNAREEIDRLPKGRLGLNFGWRVREGAIQTPAYPQERTVTPAVEPVLDYDRSQGRVSVTGGPVYRGAAIPGLGGWYLFADFNAKRFYRVDADAVRAGGTAALVEISEEVNPGLANGNVATFGTDADGEILYAGYSTGKVFRIVQAQGGHQQP